MIDHVVYDSYGNITSESSPANGDRFKYTGREYDAETGLYYYRARYYDPTTGRFIAQDPRGFAAGDANLYRYVGNGPTRAGDPTGLDPDAYDRAMREYMARSAAQQQAMIAWSMAHSTPGSGSSVDYLDAADQFFAGMGDALTGGLTTRMREEMYGEIASRNHSGGMFVAGQVVGTGVGIGIGFGNPCSMGQLGTGVRIINGMDAAGNAINAYEAYQNGNYMGAALSALAASGSMADMLRPCFAAGTPLLTPDGSKPIEQFRPGDWVLAAPEDDPEGPVEPRMVEEVFQNYAPLLYLRVGGRTIRTTAEHPFWVRGRGWTQAHQLIAGDHLRSHDGRWVVLDAVVGGQEAARLYNMRIADYHTYFVGEPTWGFAVWSHNTRCGPYAHLDGTDRTKIESGRSFTGSQKDKILKENMRRNGGVIRSDDPLDPYQDLVLPPQGRPRPGEYPSVPPNQAQIDHITPRIGPDGRPLGTNDYSNAQVISAYWNNAKSNSGGGSF